jgi:hypothetical protein
MRRWALLAILGCLLPAAGALGQTTRTSKKAHADGFEWTPSAYVQFDLRSFSDWDLLSDDSARLERRDFEMRRLRGGLEGSWKTLGFELSIDPVDEDGTIVKDAFVDLEVRKWLRLRAGQFKLPGGREYATAPRRVGFLERSSLSSALAAGRDLGARAELRLRRDLRADTGIFVGDGRGRQARAGWTAAGRINWEPFRHADVGVSASLGEARAVVDAAPENGVNGRSATGYRFFDRLYVNGRRRRLGADVQWVAGPWRLNAEILDLREQRRAQAADASDLPDLVGRGVTISTRWQRKRPLVGFRYDRLAFDDVGPETGAASVRPRASDIRPLAVEGLTLSAGWRVAPWLLALGDASAERYLDARSAPSPGRRGPYLTVGARLQLELP